jgi:signal peptidase II
MIAISVTLLGVIISDQVVKQLLRRVMGPDVASLGPFGQIRIVPGRLWLWRLRGPSSRSVMWILWPTAAVALVAASRWIADSSVFVGLLLGGSLSNAVEGAYRGSVIDYVCMRSWPAFNLADLALAVGALGTLATLAIAIGGTA